MVKKHRQFRKRNNIEAHRMAERDEFEYLKYGDWNHNWLKKFAKKLGNCGPWLPDELTDQLQDNQEFMNQRDWRGRTALYGAIQFKKYNLATLLLYSGCKSDLAKYNKTNCLHMAAANGELKIVTLLLRFGLPVDGTDSGNRTAVLIACRFGHTNIVEKLIKFNCNLRIPDEHGFYPIHYAVMGCVDTNLLKLLAGHETEHTITPYGVTPLMLAVDKSHHSNESSTEHCKCLATLFDSFNMLDTANNLYLRDRLLFGGNVLHYAVDSDCCKCVRKLTNPDECHARPIMGIDNRDLSGRTPLMLAVQMGRVMVVRTLLKYAEIDVSPGSVNSLVLHVAAAMSRWHMVEVLCWDERLLTLINTRDCFGDTPLSLAYHATHEFHPYQDVQKTIGHLIKYGATCSHCPLPHTEDKIEPRNEWWLPLYNQEVETYKDHLDKIRRLRYHDPSECRQRAINNFQRRDNPPLPVKNWFAHSPIFKTYSPITMALIKPISIPAVREHLKKSLPPPGSEYRIYRYLSESQIGVIIHCTASFKPGYLRRCRKFLQDNNPGFACTALSLQELCRGFIRRRFGYRADEKVRLLSASPELREFLNMKKLDEFRDKFYCRTDERRKIVEPETPYYTRDEIDVNDEDILVALQCRRKETGKPWI